MILVFALSRKVATFRDMKSKRTQQSIAQQILKTIRSRAELSVFSAKDFLPFGRAVTVRKALERLASEGKIRRVVRGHYDCPRPHPILGKTGTAALDLVRSVMRAQAAQWTQSGADAANQLHLSDQVPAKITILTNGTSRRLKLGNLTLTFRKAAPRNLLGAGTNAGAAFQAIRNLGPRGMSPENIQRLRAHPDPALKAGLKTMLPQTPAWMQPVIQQIIS
jgi:hypothetical protein